MSSTWRKESRFQRCLSTDGRRIKSSAAASTGPRLRPGRVRFSNPSPSLPAELAWEILKWVPAKSLMRFKSVSKLWRSIIQDPRFARDFRGGFRGILISAPNFLSTRLALETDLYYLSIHDCPPFSKIRISHQLTVDHGGRWTGSTAAVNGLVCFYDRNRSSLYNIATRERMPLPVSNHEAQGSNYHLGFDPISKLYKLLKFCPIYKDYVEDNDFADYEALFVRNLSCEIFTIGVDSSWRSIDSVPFEIRTRSSCYDGVLYWTKHPGSETLLSYHLIAFDIASEKFRIIYEPALSCGYVQHFGPRLAVITLASVEDGIEEANIYYPGESEGLWNQSVITLPEEEDEECYAPAGTLPNGKLLIATDNNCVTYFPLKFYLFDPVKQEFELIVARCNPAPGGKDISGNMYYHEENIISLRCLNSCL